MLIVKQKQHSDTLHPFDLRDRGLLLGDGVFDTSRICQGEIMLKAAHLARLKRSASMFGIDWPQQIIEDTLSELKAAQADGILRLTLTRGPSGRGVATQDAPTPTLMAHVSAFDPRLQGQVLRLQTSTVRRNAQAPSSQHKTLAYIDNIYADQQAKRAGFDLPLLLNTDARVSSVSIGNIFALNGQTLTTPPPSEGVIAGIIRDWILTKAPALGYTVIEAPLHPDMLKQAQHVFMTNSVRLICPVSQIDSTHISPDLPDTLQTALMAQMGWDS